MAEAAIPDCFDARPAIGQVLHRLYLAGAEVLAAELARRLRDRYRFVFLCLDEVGPLGGQLAAEGFTVLDLHRRPGVDLGVARRIRQAVREHGIALLHAHQYTPFFYAAASRRLSPRPRILFTEHGRHYPDFRRPKRVLANRFLLRRRDRVTAVGRWTRQCLIDNEGLRGERIEVVYNGIQPDKYELPDRAAVRAATRRELGVGPDVPLLLQIARFHAVKDHGTAIRAHARLVRGLAVRSTLEAPRLVLAGDGTQRREMEQLAAGLGIAEMVRFLGVRSDIPQLLAAADVFVLSSLSEGISVTLLEAMAAGLPIAATDVGGNPEVVVHGQTGLLSPRRDPEALATNLALLLSDAALRERLGQAGRARLRELFTEDRMHARYAEIYAQMLAR